MGKLLRLTDKLYNTPHLMLPASLERVFSYLDDRNMEKSLAVELEKKPKEREIQYVQETKTGVIPVHGPLTYIEYAAMCGEQNSSYQQIKNDFDTLIKMGAERIVLDVDSPGGEAYGMMETGRYMRMKADEKGCSIIAYVDGLSASAAYGLSVAAHEVVLNPDAEAGSVGVVVRLRNTNQAMKNMGVQDTYIYAGDNKIPFNAEGGFREDFLADIQYKVDTLYQQFTDYVAEMRGIDVGVVKNTQAKVMMAADSVKIGMADKIMSREEFYNYVADLVETGGKPMPLTFKSEGVTKMTDVSEEQMVAMQGELSQAVATVEDMKSQMSVLVGEKEQLAAMLEDMRVKAEAALQEVETLKAEKADAKAKSRKSAIAECVAEDRVEALFASMNLLDDSGFATVLASLRVANEKEEALFKEVGFSGGNSDNQKNAMDKALEAIIAKK